MKVLISLTLVTATIMTANLINSAKEVGLQPIPSSKIDNTKKTITNDKTELDS